MKQSISLADLAKFEQNITAKDKAVSLGVQKNGIHASSENQSSLNAFSITVDGKEVCNQMQSGRCWMFASLNVMRLDVMNKLNLENMELSQSYPLFFDKLERANYFLESIIDTLDEDLDSRLVQFLLTDPMGDGGQWDMFRSLVAKYGVVPKDVMPETYSSSHTAEMNTYLTKKLREFACQLRQSQKDPRQLKDEMLADIYRILTVCLGTPPTEFVWETYDKDKNFIRIQSNPVQFFKDYVGWNLDDYVSVIHAPTADKPMMKSYTVAYLGSVVEGAYPVKYVNLPIERVKELVIDQLKAGQAVWFGCDVGQFSNREKGLLTMDALAIESVLGVHFGMSKQERLDYHESLMTHAMVFTGVNLVDGKPNRWKVENSWGKDRGFDGYFVMDDEWFSEFVFQVLVRRSDLNEAELAAYDEKPTVLKPWDPMGALA